ncbi:MAG: hypothetical protein ACK5Q5_17530 [Planctomycetaceae bacterium]
MKFGLPRWILLGAVAGLLCGLSDSVQAQGQQPGAAPASAGPVFTPRPGQVTEESLGALITTLGLKPNKVQQRYDFAFTAKLDGEEEWQLSMSTVLSQDGQWLWVMAWLDELPTNSADIPRTALLRLLAENDRLGNGKFFAWIPANRRFVMQVSVANEDMTSAKLQEIMKDLGTAVVETYPQWSVANWKQGEAGGESAAPATTTGPAAATATPSIAR